MRSLSFGPPAVAGPIHDHLVAHTDTDGTLSQAGAELPDEDRDGIPWAPGALDGVLGHHTMRSDTTEAVAAIYDALRQRAARPRSRRAWVALYDVLYKHKALPIVDPLLERLRGSPLPAQRLHETGRLLATTARHREPVKYGIALVGITGGPADRELLHVLGRHSEFTLYSAVALENVSDDWETELWQLARQVHDWGRVHLVERLRNTERADIRRWLLVSSLRDQSMSEYLALVAAVSGGLAEALVDDPDDEVIEAACEIVTALIKGLEHGPAGNMNGYADGPRAVLLLVRHLSHRASSFDHVVTAGMIRRFVADATEHQVSLGWTPELRAEVSALCTNLLTDARWPALVRDALATADFGMMYTASRVARFIGMDAFDLVAPRVIAAPMDADNWYTLMRYATDENLDRIVALATDLLSLNEITTSDDRAAHDALDEILQELRQFPGKCWPLLDTALRSPSIDNRRNVLDVLFAWDRWPAVVESAVRAALAVEPDDDVRQQMTSLLSDHTSPEAE